MRGNHGWSEYIVTYRACCTRNFDSHADHSRLKGLRTTAKTSQSSAGSMAASCSGGSWLSCGVLRQRWRPPWIPRSRLCCPPIAPTKDSGSSPARSATIQRRLVQAAFVTDM